MNQLASRLRAALQRPCAYDFLRVRRVTGKLVAHRPDSQTSAAKELGVTREHLNRVLNGKRQSRSLARRYQALLSRAA